MMKLKVKTQKLEVVWAGEVVDALMSLAKDNGWQLDKDDVDDCLYDNTPWTWGDAAYTLITANVFVEEVLEAIRDTAIVKGEDFSFDYKFDLVGLEG